MSERLKMFGQQSEVSGPVFQKDEPQRSAIFKLTKYTLYLLHGCYEIKGAFYTTLFLTNVSANHPPLCSSKSILDIEYKTQHILGT